MEFIKGLDSIVEQKQREFRAYQNELGRNDDRHAAEGSDSDDDGEDEPEEDDRPSSTEPSSRGQGHPSTSVPQVTTLPARDLRATFVRPTSVIDPVYLDAVGASVLADDLREPELPPRGQLLFHTDMEGANLGRIVQANNGVEYELYLRHDTLSPRHRLWFQFGVSNGAPEQRVLFSIVNFSKARAQYRDGLAPLVRSKRRPVWQRLPTRNIFYYKSARHKAPYLLSFLFAFDEEEDTYEFAFCYPYSYADLQADLTHLRGHGYPHLRIETLCRSTQLRRVDVLTIADPAQEAREVSELRRRRPVVFISARVHPGETPSSHAMKGLIQFLVSAQPAAIALRKHVTFVLVPMLNPDGVALGNYRTDATGVDLNRFWNRAIRDLDPSNHAVLTLLGKIHGSKTHSLDLFLDLHAHSSAKVHFCLCNSYDPASPIEAERNTALLRIMEANVLGFSFHQCVFDNDTAKEGCARRVVAVNFPRTLAYTLELAYFASRATPYDEVIMAAAPAPPPQGYLGGASLAYAMNNCPASSVALPYYNHVCAQTLSYASPACSYASQPGSGAAYKGRGGTQFHPPPGYVLDINSEQGYHEIGRGIALSIGHFYDVRMQPVRSNLVHAGMRLQLQQQLHMVKPPSTTWNSSPSVSGSGSLYNAAPGPGYAGRKKPAASPSRISLPMHTITGNEREAAPPATAPGHMLHGSGSPNSSFRAAASAPMGHPEDSALSFADDRDAAETSFLGGPGESPAEECSAASRHRQALHLQADSHEPTAPAHPQQAYAQPQPQPQLQLQLQPGRFRSAGRLLAANGREWEGNYAPLGIGSLSITSASEQGHVAHYGYSNPPPVADPQQSTFYAPPTPPPPILTHHGPMIKGQQPPVSTSPAKSPSRQSLLSKPLRSSSQSRKMLRPIEDEAGLVQDFGATGMGLGLQGGGPIASALGLAAPHPPSSPTPHERPASSRAGITGAGAFSGSTTGTGAGTARLQAVAESSMSYARTSGNVQRAASSSAIAAHMAPYPPPPPHRDRDHDRRDLLDLALVPSGPLPEAGGQPFPPRGASRFVLRPAPEDAPSARPSPSPSPPPEPHVPLQMRGAMRLNNGGVPVDASADDPLKISGRNVKARGGRRQMAPRPPSEPPHEIVRNLARAAGGSGANRLGGGFARTPLAAATAWYAGGAEGRPGSGRPGSSRSLGGRPGSARLDQKIRPTAGASDLNVATEGMGMDGLGAGMAAMGPALLGLHHLQSFDAHGPVPAAREPPAPTSHVQPSHAQLSSPSSGVGPGGVALPFPGEHVYQGGGAAGPGAAGSGGRSAKGGGSPSR